MVERALPTNLCNIAHCFRSSLQWSALAETRQGGSFHNVKKMVNSPANKLRPGALQKPTMVSTWEEASRMALGRQTEVEALYEQAQKILLHEMTEVEQAFVNELGWENRATLPADRLSRLRELVRNKGNKPSAP
jgi:hypothetical protein